jgi:hypothetical protein
MQNLQQDTARFKQASLDVRKVLDSIPEEKNGEIVVDSWIGIILVGVALIVAYLLEKYFVGEEE